MPLPRPNPIEVWLVKPDLNFYFVGLRDVPLFMQMFPVSFSKQVAAVPMTGTRWPFG